jgi:hypothetical protein
MLNSWNVGFRAVWEVMNRVFDDWIVGLMSGFEGGVRLRTLISGRTAEDRAGRVRSAAALLLPVYKQCATRHLESDIRRVAPPHLSPPVYAALADRSMIKTPARAHEIVNAFGLPLIANTSHALEKKSICEEQWVRGSSQKHRLPGNVRN